MSICVMADIAGTELTADDKVFIQQEELSGLIFFSRNYESRQQLKALCDSIKAIRPDMIISVDQEGGRVQRFREGFLRLPPMRVLGEAYDLDPNKAISQSEALGWLMAAELIHHGIDISFAPVLDLDYQRSGVIGDRAFADTPIAVAELAEAFIKGMNDAGMSATAKHFPGHGYVAADSHLELPTDTRTETELQQDLIPFQRLIAKGCLQGMMPAHVVYPAIDSENTAGFSNIWLQDILRNQLNFDGLIYSDDLSMEGAAVSGSPAVRAEKAQQAGANVLLICNNRDAAQEIVDTVRAKQWPLMKLSAMSAQVNITSDLYESSLWLKNKEIVTDLLP